MSQPHPRAASVSIDFGTSNTVVAIRRADGRVQQQLFDGSPQLPSAVHLDAAGELEVGADAIHSARRRPERGEPNPKRRVDDGTILLGEDELPVTDVVAAVLGRVRRDVEQSAGGLGQVAMTVPATWGPTRRHVIADAAVAAGLGSVALVAEPVAAATYFVSTLGNEVPPGAGVVVYDLGGGTFDASVLRLGPSGFEVLAVDGADDLGGIDLDHALVEHLAATARPDDERWERLRAPATPADRRHRVAVLDEVRRAKERLSRQTSTELTVALLDLDLHLTRDELEAVALPLLERTVRITQGVIRESGLPTASIAGLFLVGAASRIPLAGTLLHRAVGIAPATIEQPELAVAEGGLNAFAVTAAPPSPATVQFTAAPPSPSPAWPHATGPHATPPRPTPPQAATASLPPQSPTVPQPLAPVRGKRAFWSSGAGIATAAGVFVAVVALVAATVLLNGRDDDEPGTGPDTTAAPAEAGGDRAAGQDESEDPVDPAAYYAEEYGDFEAFTVDGSGDEVVDLPEGVETGIVTAEYDAVDSLSMFELRSLDADNQESYDTMLYAFGGMTTLNGTFGVAGLHETAKFKVTASSEWTLTVSPIGDAEELTDGHAGTGGAVLLYNGEAATWDVEHSGAISFTVVQMRGRGIADAENWASGTGDYSGTAAGKAGPSVIVVAADGDWTITRQ